MQFHRGALKRNAKSMIFSGNPAFYLITLVFLLATDWVSLVVDLITTNPLDEASDLINSWSALLVSSDGSFSQVAWNAMLQQVWACFRGGQAMVALFAALLVYFYIMVMDMGYAGACLRVMRGQDTGYGELFSRFYMAAKIIVLQLMILVLVMLWSMLFIIPGIIASYRYSMATYIMLDDPEVSPWGAIRRSGQLMRGHKLECLVLDLSFIGWTFLATVIYNLSYSLVIFATSQTVLATIVSAIFSTAIYMLLGSYRSLTFAGYYLFLLADRAPKVNAPVGSYGPYDALEEPEEYEDDGDFEDDEEFEDDNGDDWAH